MSFNYELPVQGATPPTQIQSARINEVAGVYTGVSETDSFTITHNMQLSSAQLAEGLPEVEFEALTTDFYTEEPIVESKTSNTVVIGVTGTATSAFLRVRVKRPNTLAL